MINSEYLSKKSKCIRRNIAEMCIEYGGHIASSLSCVDILVALYHGKILSVSPEECANSQRDRFILSKGHAEAALYAVLSDIGFFPKSLIDDEYRHGGCKLGGHPSHKIPGVEWSTGSLGHGIGVACGKAMAAKVDSCSRHHFVLVGDSECTEGSIWEAAMFAAAQKLGNLTVIIDRNHLGVLESTESFTSLDPLDKKWEAFNWDVYKCDGHEVGEMRDTLSRVKNRKNDKPAVVIAETVKGKGVSFIENEPLWHVKSLNNPEEIALARKILSED